MQVARRLIRETQSTRGTTFRVLFGSSYNSHTCFDYSSTYYQTVMEHTFLIMIRVRVGKEGLGFVRGKD